MAFTGRATVVERHHHAQCQEQGGAEVGIGYDATIGLVFRAGAIDGARHHLADAVIADADQGALGVFDLVH